jgi:N-acetylglucosaminyldiphosphoundecaprenol N-acetyl-beta-D-mannosaminyltransferase
MAERYLIVQLADIGDLIVSTPALAALREAKPDAHIALLTTAHTAPILNGTNLVDDIITFDKGHFNSSRAFFRPANLRQIFSLRHGHYDTVLFFHHFTFKHGTIKFALIGMATGAKRRIGLDNGNGWFLTDRIPDGGFGAKHQAQYWLDLVGLLGGNTAPRPAVIGIATPNDKSRISNKKPRIVIHAGSGGYSTARRWDTQKFAQVADRLVETFQAEIVLVGTQDDDGLAVKTAMKSEAVDMIGKTKLDTLARLIADAALFIGADSGVMHIAAAAGTPVIAVFGPSNPEAWSPWIPDGKRIIVRSVPECSPCSYVGHSIGLREGCAARTCMRMVMPDDVFAAAQQILEDNAIDEDLKLSSTKPIFTRRIHILGLPVDGITYAEWLDLIDEWVKTGIRPAHVCTINPEFMMIARHDPNFRNILQRADLCVPDGVGLLWAAKRRKTPLPQRVTGSDGVPIIAERSAQKGWRLFFLGAAPGVADQAANILCAQYPGLQIVGTYSGSPAPDEEDALVQMVNDSSADILFVAYGAPEQDKWIARNLPRLRVKMAMGVGGSLDFIAGLVPRAPLWMQKMGLEWLFRLYLQPWRIRRMLRLPRFVLAVMLEKQSAVSRQPSAKDNCVMHSPK